MFAVSNRHEFLRITVQILLYEHASIQLKLKRLFGNVFEFFIQSTRPSFTAQLHERQVSQLQICTYTLISQMEKDKMKCLELNRNYCQK
jgi:hypothetical protein